MSGLKVNEKIKFERIRVCIHLRHNPYVAWLVRAIHEIAGYRGQAAVRKGFRVFKQMNCKHALFGSCKF